MLHVSVERSTELEAVGSSVQRLHLRLLDHLTCFMLVESVSSMLIHHSYVVRLVVTTTVLGFLNCMDPSDALSNSYTFLG